MQKTVEYTANRISPATIELLIRERSKGKTLRQLGRMFDRSHEKIRQLLDKYQHLLPRQENTSNAASHARLATQGSVGSVANIEENISMRV